MYRSLRPVAVLLACLAGATVLLRAQVTETPVTVQPGHFLIEADLLSLTLDRNDDGKYTGFGAGLVFVTTGVTRTLDVQVGAQLFLSQDFDSEGFSESDSGVGDVYLRTKWHFYESTTTWTSVAVIPYLKFPTNGGVGNDSVEGGLVLPWETRVLGDMRLSAMAQVDIQRNAADDGYDTFWYVSSAASHQLTKQIGLYAEAAIGKSSGGDDYEGILGGGVTYSLTENLWFDLAAYHGFSGAAADWNYVLRLNFGF